LFVNLSIRIPHTRRKSEDSRQHHPSLNCQRAEK